MRHQVLKGCFFPAQGGNALFQRKMPEKAGKKRKKDNIVSFQIIWEDISEVATT